MEIKLKEITIREVVDSYVDNDEDGVLGYGGKLNIRPKYQREFVYNEKQRNAVIDTITKEFPLNVMYWAVRDDGTFEIIDGQQRTVSLCQFINNEFSVQVGDIPGVRNFYGLQDDEQEKILNYPLMIYFCEGKDSEKLKWFETINIAGEQLKDQELKNAVYSGSWVTDAKRHFSKSGCPAYGLASKYLNGSAIRQDYLETAIKWISGDEIKEYMAKNQREPNANEMWIYFQNVIAWVQVIFPKYRKEMKGLEWGTLYNEFKDKNFDSEKLELEISGLMQDDDVSKKSGIYQYVLTRDEKYLNIRAFTDNQKRETYEKQKGVCTKCKEHFEIEEMEADHITPWHEGGKTDSENCQILCRDCNRRKSGK